MSAPSARRGRLGLAFAPSPAGFLNAAYTELRLTLVQRLTAAGERRKAKALANASQVRRERAR